MKKRVRKKKAFEINVPNGPMRIQVQTYDDYSRFAYVRLEYDGRYAGSLGRSEWRSLKKLRDAITNILEKPTGRGRV